MMAIITADLDGSRQNYWIGNGKNKLTGINSLAIVPCNNPFWMCARDFFPGGGNGEAL